MRRRVLSIDWDYFTEDNQLCEPCKICRWDCWDFTDCRPKNPVNRIRNNQQVCTDPSDPYAYSFTLVRETVAKWAHAIKGCPLIVADCHGSIYRFLEQRDNVINFDAHEDYDGLGGRLTCGNWAKLAEKTKKIKYTWRHRRAYRKLTALRSPMDLVFVCQSTPYTAPKLDGDFHAMLKLLSKTTRSTPRFVGMGARKMRRLYVKSGGVILDNVA